MSRPMDQALQEIEEWRSRGRLVDVDGRAIFAIVDGEGPRSVVLLHGFPSSSFDWRRIVPALVPFARVVAFDFLGYGLSDKPFDATYTAAEQARIAERVLGAVGVERSLLVAHDMGNGVAAELLRRAQADHLALDVEGLILTNGSVTDQGAELPSGQRLLLSVPDEPLPMPLPLETLVPGLAGTFSREHPPSRDDLEAMLWLVGHREGDRLLPRLVRHVEERRRSGERWTAALAAFPGPLALLWGEQDPLVGVEEARRLGELRAGAEVETWPDVGHWPALEVPERLSAAILKRLLR